MQDDDLHLNKKCRFHLKGVVISKHRRSQMYVASLLNAVKSHTMTVYFKVHAA